MPLDDPALLERGDHLLGQYQELRKTATAPVEIPVPDDTKDQLRALGYIE
jgi:hypothetical protein